MRVVVFGAGGKVGRLLVPQLVEAGHEVVGVIHREASGPGVEASGGTPVVVDLEGDVAAVREVLTGADAAVWSAGADTSTGTDHSDRLDRDGAQRAIAAGAELGVGRWIQISSLYADRIDSAPPVLQHFLGNKAAADDAARASAMTATVVRPGGLTDDEGTGLVSIQAEGMGHGMVTRADVASVIAAALTNDVARDMSFDLATGTTTIDEALRAL